MHKKRHNVTVRLLFVDVICEDENKSEKKFTFLPSVLFIKKILFLIIGINPRRYLKFFRMNFIWELEEVNRWLWEEKSLEYNIIEII